MNYKIYLFGTGGEIEVSMIEALILPFLPSQFINITVENTKAVMTTRFLKILILFCF
ncbi:hypothetical protein [Flavobacterium ovatum]|uniref:hypothetical protein n=1 Tax=Flavobacterium ovatum TaxID=1928857 RepID=UPI00344DEC93